MDPATRALPIPPAALQSTRARELLRVWVIDEDVPVVLDATIWDDPGYWGILLVDLARHAAAAYEATGKDGEAVLQRIKQVFVAEWDHPTTS